MIKVYLCKNVVIGKAAQFALTKHNLIMFEILPRQKKKTVAFGKAVLFVKLILLVIYSYLYKICCEGKIEVKRVAFGSKEHTTHENRRLGSIESLHM